MSETQNLGYADDPVVEIDHLRVSLPPGADRGLAVNDVSLTLKRGETLCVVGESGSGKSMIANAIMGLLPKPQVSVVGGRIMFAGRDLAKLGEADMRALRGNRIGMVFQEPMTALNPLMRIGEQIGEAIDAHVPIGSSEKRRRIIDALKDVGLPNPELTIDSYPFSLSGGQRQRVMIACALILEPALLICDEPTTALDVTTQAQILALVRELQSRRGTAILFITHDFGVVSEIADKVLVMQSGQGVEFGSADQVLRNPRHPYTRKLIAAIPNQIAGSRNRQDEGEQVLRLDGVCKTYRSGKGLFKKERVVTAADRVSFDLQVGQTLGVVGESGSGKSTLGRCIAGLLSFDSGTMTFKGSKLDLGAGRRRRDGKIQMVFQDPYASLNPRHRVGDAIASGPIAQGIGRPEALERTQQLLELVGLSKDAATRFPHEFSGGQRQRIGIARALALQPDLLIADEPVSALDVSVQAQVLDLFADVRERFKLSMIFITHDLRVAGMMCDHIAVMQRGAVVEYGESRSVLTNPRHPYTQRLIEAVPRLGI